MNHKSFGWAAVFGCVFSVALAVVANREMQPRSAQASTAGIQGPQACKAVMGKLDAIRQTVWNRHTDGNSSQLTAIDDLVSQQSEVDTIQCPAEFRAAEARFMAAENTLAVDAHIDFAKNGDASFRALFHSDSHQFPPDLLTNGPEAIKADLAAAHTAAENFEKVAAKFAAN
jgi:hypothetical protein